MLSKAITARFPSAEELESALWDLRRFGAVRCTPSLHGVLLERPTLHVTVRPEDMSLARAVLRRAGGTIIF